MLKPTLLFTSLLAVALAGPVSAQSAKPVSVKNGVVTTNQFVNTRKGGEEVSCEDFLSLADKFKPQAVSSAIGLNKGRDPKVKVIDVTGVEKIVPVVVSTCKSRRHGALRDTVSTVLYQR